jgi:hypothetical protein
MVAQALTYSLCLDTSLCLTPISTPLKLNDLISGIRLQHLGHKLQPRYSGLQVIDQIKALDPELPNVGLKGDYLDFLPIHVR